MNLRFCELCSQRLAIRSADRLALCGVCRSPSERQSRDAAYQAVQEAIVHLEAMIALRGCQADPDCHFLDPARLQRQCQTARARLLDAVAELAGSPMANAKGGDA